MPFVSDVQRRKCYALQRQMNKEGVVSNWDCKEFEKGSNKKTPRRSSSRRKSNSSPKKMGMNKRSNGKSEQIYKGVRGGKYVIRNNKKVYNF